MRNWYVCRTFIMTISLGLVVLSETACFKKQADSEKVVLKEGLQVKAVYNADDPTKGYLEISGECGSYGAVMVTYSSEYTPSTEVRADCSGGSQNKKKATVQKKLTITSAERPQVFNISQVAIFKSQKTNAIKSTVRYAPAPPARAGFAIVSGGVVWDDENTGASGFATFGEPFAQVQSPASVQTGGSVRFYDGLFNSIFTDN